ncbi:MAG TPA: serine/threonine-protein kinase, partial [Anaeromyxobacteraceae bacterium]|nr:serine/threonine-protein kinase [Anaeromyxobacteraceae bacterium]
MRDPVVGEKLDQYELIDLLARSGMASIFKARDGFSGATVALKIPHVQFESDVVFAQRFEREEKIMQGLDHPAVVRVLKPRDRSRMYLAMEFVEGRSLRAMMQGKPLPTEQALDLGKQVARALVYLESKGVVHRDLKPENVIVQPDGTVKILDFGIAMAETSRRLTWGALSNAIGTPDYMAPEQIRGRRGDARTDVYALGMLLYEMLTGELPWEGSNPAALLRAKANDEPRLPSWHVPGFDPSLEAIIMKAIDREPRFRYGGAAELLRDLEDPAAVAAHDPEVGQRRRLALKRARRRVVAAVAVAAALAGLLALVWLSGSGGRAPA